MKLSPMPSTKRNYFLVTVASIEGDVRRVRLTLRSVKPRCSVCFYSADL